MKKYNYSYIEGGSKMDDLIEVMFLAILYWH